jgi:hypothetical protein
MNEGMRLKTFPDELFADKRIFFAMLFCHD